MSRPDSSPLGATQPAISASASKETAIGVAAGILAALFWSTGGLMVKSIDLPALEIAGFRGLFSGLFFWALAARERASFGGWGAAAWLAALGEAFTVLLFVVATKWTTAAAAIFLQSTAPIWVMLAGVLLLGHRPGRSDLLAVAGCAVGLSLFFVGRLEGAALRGNLLGIAAGVCFGFYMLFMREVPRRQQLAVLAAGNGICAVAALLMLQAGLLETAATGARGFTFPAATEWSGLAYLGIGQIGLGYWFSMVSIRRISSLHFSLLVLLEPVLNPVWVYLGAGEHPGGWAIAGGGILLATLGGHSITKALRRGEGAAPLSAAAEPAKA